MNTLIKIAFLTTIVLVVEAAEKKVINVELGGHCTLGAAPTGPGGSWQVVEKNVEKRCPEGSSCRKGACNCNDLSDGTITSISYDSSSGVRSCRRIAGQKCSSDNQCFTDVKCVSGICTCDNKDDCVDRKSDVTILS